MWKIFEKSNQQGWTALIPIYSTYLLTRIAEKPAWWTILFFIPIVNLIFYVWVWHRIFFLFGKNLSFTIKFFLMPFIFIPILGFGDAQYKGKNPNLVNDDILDDVLEN